MTELKIPSASSLEKAFLQIGMNKREVSQSIEKTLKAYTAKFNPDDHPVCAVLGEEAFNKLCNHNTELLEKGVEPQKRLDAVTAMLDQEIMRLIPITARQAADLEKELVAAQQDGKLKSGAAGGTGAATAKAAPWLALLKKWFEFENRHYSSVRTGSASGETGSGFGKKWRTLRVVATTVANNATIKLFGFPISSISTVGCLVVATHFRAPGGLIPTAAYPLVAGATRNGVTQSASANSWIVSKATLFVDNDPNLQNLTYFGSSSDAGISLYVSGTP